MMKWTLSVCVPLFTGLFGCVAFAQDEDGHGHSDIEFHYEDGVIVVEAGANGFAFASSFPLEGVDRQFTREPGFSSALDEGFGLNAGDQIAYNVLDNLLYWNDGFQEVPAGAQIRIINQPPAPAVPDTLVSAASGVQIGGFESARNRIGEADENGEFHRDLQMFFEPDAAAEPLAAEFYGAYGVKLSLSSDAGVAESHPFVIAFNVGLDAQSFGDAVTAYAMLVPEPATGATMYIGFLLIYGIRWRGPRKLWIT